MSDAANTAATALFRLQPTNIELSRTGTVDSSL
jgi:hypothetical protein